VVAQIHKAIKLAFYDIMINGNQRLWLSAHHY